jgi:hypothetical protein
MSIKLNNPVFVIQNNLVCPATAGAGNPYLVFEANIGGQYGADLYSLSISFSSTFTQNYYYLLVIEGIQLGDQQNPNNFQQPDITSPAIDYIKQDTYISLPAGAKIKLYAYNSTGTTSNGSLSILIYKDDKAVGVLPTFQNQKITFGNSFA